MSIESNVHHAARHREILTNPEAAARAVAYMAQRTIDVEDHRVWTGRLEDVRRAPYGVTRGLAFSPRLIVWAAVGHTLWGCQRDHLPWVTAPRLRLAGSRSSSARRIIAVMLAERRASARKAARARWAKEKHP
jgi:hypothetical protein